MLRHAVFLLSRLDKAFLILAALLLAVGCLFIYGAGQQVGGDFAGFWKRQICWIFLGGGCFLVSALVDYRFISRFAWGFYAVGLLSLVLLFPFGAVINGACSWYRVPGVGTLQPAELAKPVTLLFAAWIASRPVFERTRILVFAAVGAAAAAPMLLVALQPDYGTALVFAPFSLAIVFLSGLRWRWLAAGAAVGLLLVPLAYPRLADHQKDRIKVFLEPPSRAALAAVGMPLDGPRDTAVTRRVGAFFERSGDSVNTDWNAHQSLLAVGSGGFWGKGYRQGTQHVLGFLPRTVAPTDFIFSVIAEETGFVGSAGVVFAFIGLIVCCLRTGATARDDLGRYISAGAAVILFTHAFINVGMTIRAAPIIGIPLPFVSYGGSFMLGTMILAGLVQSVHIRRHGNR